MKKTLIIVLSIIAAGLAGFGIYKFVGKGGNKPQNTDSNIKLDLSIFSQKLDSDVKKVERQEDDGDITTYTYNNYSVEIFQSGTGNDYNNIVITNNGKKVYSNYDVRVGILDDAVNVKDYLDAKPVIVKGVLYFLSIGNDGWCSDKASENLYNVDLNAIDLTKNIIFVKKINTYLLHIEGDISACKISVNVNITEKPYSGKANLDLVKSELQKKIESVDIGDSFEDSEYGILYIEDKEVVFDFYSVKDDDEYTEVIEYAISNIPNPVSVYMDEELGGEDNFPVEFYVMDSNSSIYVVNITLKYYVNSESKIYRVK